MALREPGVERGHAIDFDLGARYTDELLLPVLRALARQQREPQARARDGVSHDREGGDEIVDAATGLRSAGERDHWRGRPLRLVLGDVRRTSSEQHRAR